MKIDCLYLEVTRWCNLECEHCFRGNRKNEFMSTETIDNIFNDIKEIKCLLLTGGEPLLATNQIRDIINAIKRNNVKVKRISIITNSTILNNRTIELLNELYKLSILDIRLSYDMFHYLELDRLNIFQERQKNASVLKKYFRAREYGEISLEEESELILLDKGKAKNITNERLKEINSLSNSKYYLSEDDINSLLFNRKINYNIESNNFPGILNIDVNGNLVGYSLSFDEEDNDQYNFDGNINKLGLKIALENYMNYYFGSNEDLRLKR